MAARELLLPFNLLVSNGRSGRQGAYRAGADFSLFASTYRRASVHEK
jgi:hypothetical protein